MSVEGAALQLLRACSISPSQMMTLLQPLNNQMPSTEDEFRALQDRMRRIGRVIEHAPGNVGQSLAGNREARPGMYYQEEASSSNAPHSHSTTTYVGFQNQGASPQSAWSDWTPDSVTAPGSSMTPWYGNSTSAYQTVTGTEPETEIDYTDTSFSSGTDTDTSSDSGHEEID